MITSFSSPKTKIPLSSNSNSNFSNNNIPTKINTNKFKKYKNEANLLSIKSPNNKKNKINIEILNKDEDEDENINPNETLSNIIDAINENNLNAFYEDDNNSFKRNIDQLNLKFYLETEKIIKSSNNNISNNNNEVISNSNKLFIILFKQINLYISEIERLNAIILDSKRDPHSISKKLSVINRQKSDFEVKEQIIKTLKFSISSLEKQLANVLNSENILRQENQKLKEEKNFYYDYFLKHNKENNINNNNKENNINIKDNNNDSKILINNRYNNIKLNNSNSHNKINTSSNYIFKYNTNNSNNNITITNSVNYSSKKEDKKFESIKNNNSNSNIKTNTKNNNIENGSTNKKNDIILMAKHRRTYSAQNEDMINGLNKKSDKLSQGITKHSNTKTNRLTKQDNKNPTKIINNNINSPRRNNTGFTPVGNYKYNNKIMQSVKDGMREKYLNRKKKNIMNYNYSGANKLELILNKDSDGSFMKYKSSLYGNNLQYQKTTNGTTREEDNFNFLNKINNYFHFDNNYNINYNGKNNSIKNNGNNMTNELDFMEDLIIEVRDYLIEKSKINENNENNEIKLKQNKK